MKKRSSRGEGVYSNDITRDLNKVAFRKTLRTIELNDKYRKYKETVVLKEGERMKTFLEFKSSLRPKKKSKPTKEVKKNTPPKKKLMTNKEYREWKLNDPKRLDRLKKFKESQKAKNEKSEGNPRK
jgi:hypothetical protein